MTKRKRSLPRTSDAKDLLDDAFMKGVYQMVRRGQPTRRLSVYARRFATEAVFVKGVRRHVRWYLEMKAKKTPLELEAQFKHLAARIKRALRLARRKTQRPGEFKTAFSDIKARWLEMPEEARDYFLTSRYTGILFATEGSLTDPTSSLERINPLPYDGGQQLAALESLHGWLSGSHARPRRPGGQPKGAERFLYAMLGCSFTLATGCAANDKSPLFMGLCEAIKERCQLGEFRPEGVARSLRKSKTRERAEDHE